MARTEQSKALTAVRTNVTKWSNAIKEYTGGTEVYDVFNISETDWGQMQPTEKWKIIKEYKSGKNDLKLKRNRKSISDYDYKRLLKEIVEAESDDEKNKLLEVAKQINDYDKAKSEVESAQNAFDKAKNRLTEAKQKLKEIEDSLDNIILD